MQAKPMISNNRTHTLQLDQSNNQLGLVNGTEEFRPLASLYTYEKVAMEDTSYNVEAYHASQPPIDGPCPCCDDGQWWILSKDEIVCKTCGATMSVADV